MIKISLLVGLVVLVAMLSGCMAFDYTTNRYDDNQNNSYDGHSHH